jgi:hypothetical protein
LDKESVEKSITKLRKFKKDPKIRDRKEDIEDYRYLVK